MNVRIWTEDWGYRPHGSQRWRSEKQREWLDPLSTAEIEWWLSGEITWILSPHKHCCLCFNCWNREWKGQKCKNICNFDISGLCFPEVVHTQPEGRATGAKWNASPSVFLHTLNEMHAIPWQIVSLCFPTI